MARDSKAGANPFTISAPKFWNAAPMGCANRPITLVILSNSRFNLAPAFCGACAIISAVLPYLLNNSLENFSKSSSVTFPSSNALSNSCGVLPIDEAKIVNAPGNLSPICCLNSSADTFAFSSHP